MATELKAAMEKGELRSLLAKSKHAPVNCAVAFGDGKKSQPALILLHRSKAPNALMKEIHKDFPEAKNARFGTASVDPDTDPKLVLLQLNQAASGLASKLVKSLKGTGFSKVKVVLEDGTVAEQEAEPEEGEAPQATAARGAPADAGAAAGGPASPSAPAAPVNTQAAPQTAASPPDPPAPAAQSAAATDRPAPPQAATAPDAAAVMRRLTDLVKRLIQADPAALAGLKALAVQAQGAIKSGDVAAAARFADQLEAGLGARPAATQAAPASPSAAPAAPDPAQIAASNAANAKARVAWVATRQKVNGDLAKLHGAFTGAFKGHPAEGDLTKAFRSRVDTVLNTLGEELAHTLDAVNGATNPAERQQLVAQAHAHIAQYSKHLAADPTISALDNNPFVPLAIQKTMTATLAVLSKTIR